MKLKIKDLVKKAKNKMWQLAIIISLFFMNPRSVFAGPDIKDSDVYKGTNSLIKDLTTWAMILSPVIAVLVIIYFFIRKSAADEMDQKKWQNRIVIAVVCCIGAVVTSATLNMLMGYYGKQ